MNYSLDVLTVVQQTLQELCTGTPTPIAWLFRLELLALQRLVEACPAWLLAGLVVALVALAAYCAAAVLLFPLALRSREVQSWLATTFIDLWGGPFYLPAFIAELPRCVMRLGAIIYFWPVFLFCERRGARAAARGAGCA